MRKITFFLALLVLHAWLGLLNILSPPSNKINTWKCDRFYNPFVMALFLDLFLKAPCPLMAAKMTTKMQKMLLACKFMPLPVTFLCQRLARIGHGCGCGVSGGHGLNTGGTCTTSVACPPWYTTFLLGQEIGHLNDLFLAPTKGNEKRSISGGQEKVSVTFSMTFLAKWPFLYWPFLLKMTFSLRPLRKGHMKRS